MYFTTKWRTLMICAVMSSLLLCLAAADPLPSAVDTIPLFSQLTAKEAEMASNRIEGNYISTIDELAWQANNKNTPTDKRVRILNILGTLRSVKASRLLIQYIDITSPNQDPSLHLPEWGTYPAEEALERVGNAAVPRILIALGTESEGIRKRLLCLALRNIYGERLALISLQDAIDSARDGTIKDNLVRAKKYLMEGPTTLPLQ